MDYKNEQNIKRRLGILSVLVVLMSAAMVWMILSVRELEKAENFHYRDREKQFEQIIRKMDADRDAIIEQIRAADAHVLIDSPIETPESDINGDKQDSIKSILNEILKYYEQSTGQLKREAKA